MTRSFAFVVSSLLSGFAFVSWSIAGCSASGVTSTQNVVDASVRRDSAPVDQAEGGPAPEPSSPPTPSCEKYCELVTTHCTGDNVQYVSEAECRAFCAHLALVQPTRDEDEKQAASVACRQYWADSPARTKPDAYCLAAGPFGGNTCGDRCTAFCAVALSACSPGAGKGAYASQPECASACAMFSYRAADADGGGEGPDGPAVGDTLNCRLFWLREAVRDPTACPVLLPKSDACKN